MSVSGFPLFNRQSSIITAIEVDLAETVIVSASCVVLMIEARNISGSNLTFTAWDNDSPKRLLVPPQTVYPNSVMTYRAASPYGVLTLGGLRWQASGIGLIGYVEYIQR